MKNPALSIQIIYSAIIMGTAAFISIAALVLNNQISKIIISEEESLILYLASTLMGAMLIISGIFIVKRKVSELPSLNPLEKIKKYRSLTIIRAASIESAAILFVVLYLLLKHELFLYETLFSFLVLIIFFPTNQRLSSELNINLQDLK